MSVWALSLWACTEWTARSAEPAPPEPAASPPTVAPAPPAAPALADKIADVVPPLPTTGPFRRELAPGLVISAHVPPGVPDPGFSRPPPDDVRDTDQRLFVVTVDPAHYEIVYRSMLDPDVGGPERDAASWAEASGLHLAFNPGMFEPDRRATGYTRADAFTSQPEVRRNGLYRGWFVARSGPAPGAVEVLDIVPPKGKTRYATFPSLPAATRDRIGQYAIVSQSLAILRDGKPAYPPRKNQWSELAYGADREGRLVVVFSRFPYEMRHFGALVKALDLGIVDLIHGEGGPEASLAIRVGSLSWAVMGSYETGFSGDGNRDLWSLPAVMGARPRGK